MKTPYFSVILPTYNREALTIRALQSILAQTFRDFEVIIIDDGSRPALSTSESLKDLLAARNKDLLAAHSSTPLTLITTPRNKGVSTARNKGIAKASGKWIALLDSDDVWHPEKLSKQFTFIQQHPHFRISQCEEVWIRKNVRVNPKNHYLKHDGEQFAPNLEHCLITASSVIIERDLLTEWGGFDERLRVCEDYDLWIRITAHYPVGLLSEKLTTRYQESYPETQQLSLHYPVLDWFRIRALATFVRSSSLHKTTQRHRACEVLLAKCTIVKQGARKRRRWLLWWKTHRIQHWGRKELSRLEALLSHQK